MNKPLATVLLVLALSACSEPAHVSAQSTDVAPSARIAATQAAASARDDRVAAAQRDMSKTGNIDPQTDNAIDAMLGNHVAYHKAITDFQKAVAAHDTDTVASMVRYPMTVEVGGEKVVIENSGRFKQFYGKLIPPETEKQIAGSTYSDVMINRHGVLLGDGQTFMSADCNGSDCKNMEVKISNIQPRPAN